MSAAVDKRVDAGKTLALGPMGEGLAQAIRCAYTSSCIFPMGPSQRRYFLVRPRTLWGPLLEGVFSQPMTYNCELLMVGARPVVDGTAQKNA